MKRVAVDTSTTLQKKYLPISATGHAKKYYYECMCGIVTNVAAVSLRALHREGVYITVSTICAKNCGK